MTKNARSGRPRKPMHPTAPKPQSQPVVLSMRIPTDLAEDLVSVGGASDPVDAGGIWHGRVYRRADPSTPLSRLLKPVLLMWLSQLIAGRMLCNRMHINALEPGEHELLATKRQSAAAADYE